MSIVEDIGAQVRTGSDELPVAAVTAGLARLRAGDSGWEKMVPPEVARMIKEREFFGYRAPVAA